jgi:hypothetical protein
METLSSLQNRPCASDNTRSASGQFPLVTGKAPVFLVQIFQKRRHIFWRHGNAIQNEMIELVQESICVSELQSILAFGSRVIGGRQNKTPNSRRYELADVLVSEKSDAGGDEAGFN